MTGEATAVRIVRFEIALRGVRGFFWKGGVEVPILFLWAWGLFRELYGQILIWGRNFPGNLEKQRGTTAAQGLTVMLYGAWFRILT